MIHNFKLDTGGVFILCSKIGLKKYFDKKEDKTFNYNFPEGILPLVNENVLVAFVSESGEDVKGRITINESEEIRLLEKGFVSQATYSFLVEELLILSHGEFTQICDWHQGDASLYSFGKIKKLKAIPAGSYTIEMQTKVPKNGYLIGANLHFSTVDNVTMNQLSDLVRV
jgi:hypothetical protein